jgi:multicomponent Na+:H+ antiporter subunit F
VLLVSVVLGLVRVMLGPTPTDRMLAAQLMGSAGVAMLVLLAQAFARPSLLDVALVFAVLAAVAAVAFVRRYTPSNAGVEP